MTKERWNSLSYDARRRVLRDSDRSMQDPRWQPLIGEMAAHAYEDLTVIQQTVVKELR